MVEKERNLNIELLRIIFCILVICNHVLSRFTYHSSGEISNYFLLFLGSLNRIAVPGFFMITGYFLFREERNYKYILKKALKLFIPAFIVIVLIQVLEPFIFCKESLVVALSEFKFDFLKTINSILSFNMNELANYQYLFFVFEYIWLLLLYPIFKLICKDNPNCRKVRIYLMIYTFITQLFIPNISEFIPGLQVSFPQLIRIKHMYVFIGYDIYLYYNKSKKNHFLNHPFLEVLVYVVAAILQTLLFYLKTEQYGFVDFDSRLITSETCFVFFGTISLFLLFIHLDLSKVNNNLKSIIRYIARQTYGIYLVHWPIMEYLLIKNNSIYDRLFTPYYVVIICFIVSFFITIIIKLLVKLIYQLGNTMKNKLYFSFPCKNK